VKRGTSGLCLVVGVDKPAGMTSHDVVNRCRRIFGEKRVGHTGTLDPAASGVLPICVGPATRLSSYMTGHDKAYSATVSFGSSTDTDDAEGQVIQAAIVPDEIADEGFARSYVSGMVGQHKQMPPAYSAIKVAGKKACDEARRGNIIDLTPRDIEVYSARLIEVRQLAESDSVEWDVEFHVSKGTYIRALARDMGKELHCPAHLHGLRRIEAGRMTLEDCISLEALEDIGTRAALDPVRLLGFRFAFADDALAAKVMNGTFISLDQVKLFEYGKSDLELAVCSCTSGVCESPRKLVTAEIISVISNNKLVALYEFDSKRACFKPCCVFQTGVSRGCDI
jgi:tRNA pseudouridine55 synthase